MKKLTSYTLAIISMLILVLPLLCANAQEIYYISDESELFSIENDPSATYYLKNDIVVSGSYKTMFPDKGKPFSGILDGCGYKISCHNPIDEGEILSFIGYSNGDLLNLNFENSTIVTTRENVIVSGIVGFNYGTIINCTFSGTVLSGEVLQKGFGIYGYNFGELKNNREEVYLSEQETSSSVSSDLYISGISSSSISSELIGIGVSSEEKKTSSKTESPKETHSSSGVSSYLIKQDTENSSTNSEIRETFNDVEKKEDRAKNNKFAATLMGISLCLLVAIIIYAVYLEIKRVTKKPPQK